MKLNYKYIALGILVGYLMPYMIALLKSYQEKENPNKETTQAPKEYVTSYAH